MSTDEARALERVRSYHQRSKHHPQRFARALGYLDWSNQPDPFRRFEGAPATPLALVEPGPEPRWPDLFGTPGEGPPRPVDLAAVSQLLQDSMALSASKQLGDSRWFLRVNPSSGNLHPTEAYLLLPAVEGLPDAPGLFHYRPEDHALELRRRLSPAAVVALEAGLGPGGFALGLSSIVWREAWKYGERAFRYCQHDVGHALACVALAAKVLGWRASLLRTPGDAQVAAALALEPSGGPEAEHPDLLLAITPAAPVGEQEGGAARAACAPPTLDADALGEGQPLGAPNSLSPTHHPWPLLTEVAAAARKPAGWASDSEEPEEAPDLGPVGPPPAPPTMPARALFRQRRSAVRMDGRTGLSRAALAGLLGPTLVAAGAPPLEALGEGPHVHLLLFVHRVAGLERGLYLLARSPGGLARLRRACTRPELEWVPLALAPGLDLHLLERGDVRGLSRRLSCDQEIASDGAFAVAMLAEFDGPLARHGAWFYRHLHWEAGALGQLLYLGAEAAGVRATGIGCFFDDATHAVLGLEGTAFQDLYHFTVGGPTVDERLRVRDPYAARG